MKANDDHRKKNMVINAIMLITFLASTAYVLIKTDITRLVFGDTDRFKEPVINKTLTESEYRELLEIALKREEKAKSEEQRNAKALLFRTRTRENMDSISRP